MTPSLVIYVVKYTLVGQGLRISQTTYPLPLAWRVYAVIQTFYFTYATMTCKSFHTLYNTYSIWIALSLFFIFYFFFMI